jgi:hypothetical protein
MQEEEVLTVIAPRSVSMVRNEDTVTFTVKIHNTTTSKLRFEFKLISDDCVLYGLTPFPQDIEPFRSYDVRVRMVYGSPRRQELLEQPERAFALRFEVPAWKYRVVGDYNRRIDVRTTVGFVTLMVQAKAGEESHLHYVAWI